MYSDVGSWIPDDSNFTSEYRSTIDMSCLTDGERKNLQDAGYHWNDTTGWLAYKALHPAGLNASELMAEFGPNLEPVLPINPACIYQTDIATVMSINFYLAKLFQGSAGVAAETLRGSSDLMSAIFNGGNVSNTTIESNFKNISNSMTSFIRQNGVPINSPFVAGNVLQIETCVHVRWEWLTFPAALFALTLILFVGMVVQTTSKSALLNGSHDFKSSALPLVFCAVEPELPQGFWERKSGMNEMTEEARQIKVRLSKSESGWKFIKDD
jgi:hypothetical protein